MKERKNAAWESLRNGLHASNPLAGCFSTKQDRASGEVQFDLFEPRDHNYACNVSVTNQPVGAAVAMLFHNGRGNQEAVLGERKHWASLGHVPYRRLVASQLYSGRALLAQKLGRELQMVTNEPRTTKAWPSRVAIFDFSTLGTLRHLFLRRAGSLARPVNRLTLTLAASGPACKVSNTSRCASRQRREASIYDLRLCKARLDSVTSTFVYVRLRPQEEQR